MNKKRIKKKVKSLYAPFDSANIHLLNVPKGPYNVEIELLLMDDTNKHKRNWVNFFIGKKKVWDCNYPFFRYHFRRVK